MNMDWILQLISIPLLLIPTLAIMIDYCLRRINFFSHQTQLIKENLNLFTSILEYDIGGPSPDEIVFLQNKLKEKSHFLDKTTYEQIRLGYKKVNSLCPLLRRQKDNRDNDLIIQLKQELHSLISEIQK